MATAATTTTSAWQQVVTAGDYLLQNRGVGDVLVYVGGTPSANSVGFLLKRDEVISSSIAPGVVYVKSTGDTGSTVIVFTV